MLDACWLMPDACLLLAAWCLNTCQTHPQRVPQRGAAEGRPPLWRRPKAASLCGWVWQVFKHQAASSKQASGIKQQASSIKQQASSIKHQASVLSPINAPRKLKHFWPDRSRLFFGTRLFQILRFPDFQLFRLSILTMLKFSGFQFWKCWVWEVWYYQSGPKSVSINPYGIPEPPKPLRNCQSLDWVQKTKKFESLAEI